VPLTPCAPPRTERFGADSSAQPQPYGVEIRTPLQGSRATRCGPQITTHDSRIPGSDHETGSRCAVSARYRDTIHIQANKRLMATHDKLEISPTQSKHRTSHFLIATRNAFPDFHARQSLNASVLHPPPFAQTYTQPARTGRDHSGEIPFFTQDNPSGQMQFVFQGRDNFSSGFNIVSSEASRVLEVYNPGRFLRRHP